MSLLLLLPSAAAAVEPSPVRVNRYTRAQTVEIVRSQARAAAALLLLLSAVPDSGTASVTATLDDATLSTVATVETVAAEPALVRVNRYAHAETVEIVRSKSGPAADLLLLLSVVPGEATATLAVTLDEATLAATAATDAAGTSSAALDALTFAGTAATEAIASAAPPLGDLTFGSSAATEATGSTAAALDDLAATSAATIDAGITGNLAAALDDAELTAAAQTAADATATATLDGATVATAAATEAAATSSSTLDDATLAATATVENVAVEGPVVWRRLRPMVLLEAFEVGRRYHLIPPADTSPSGGLSVELDSVALVATASSLPTITATAAPALDGVTLASAADVIAEDYDYFLGGDTRQEAQPKPDSQWPRRRWPHVVTSLTATYEGSASPALDGVTLATQGATLGAGAVSVALDGLTLASGASFNPELLAGFSVTLEPVGLATSSASTVTATATLVLSSLGLTAQGSAPIGGSGGLSLDGVGFAGLGVTSEGSAGGIEATLDALSLSTAAQTQITAAFVGTLDGVDLVSVRLVSGARELRAIARSPVCRVVAESPVFRAIAGRVVWRIIA